MKHLSFHKPRRYLDRKSDKAVALGYDPMQDRSPQVLAVGKGEVARRILELARENDIPVHQDAALAEKLAMLDLNTEIPPELFQIVAELLVFLYRLDDRWKQKVMVKG
jgi:flagellar biosynthesis protein